MHWIARAALVLIAAAACTGVEGPLSSGNSPRTGCTATPGDRSQGAERVPIGAPSRTRLGPGKELSPTADAIAAGARGERLTVSGTVYDGKCRPLAGAAVDAWQVTADGVYGPVDAAGGLVCCYLTGQVRTDPQGHYELLTVMPGHYASAAAHIHIAVSGPVGGQVLTEIQFAGDPALGSRDQLNVVSLTKEADGGLRAVFDVVLADA